MDNPSAVQPEKVRLAPQN